MRSLKIPQTETITLLLQKQLQPKWSHKSHQFLSKYLQIRPCHHLIEQWFNFRQKPNVTEPGETVNIAQSVCLCTACNLLQTCNLAATDEIFVMWWNLQKRKKKTRRNGNCKGLMFVFILSLAYLTFSCIAKVKTVENTINLFRITFCLHPAQRVMINDNRF